MSSGFITESEIEAKKVARQAEWDAVRKPDDPVEAPEEAAPDNRSLYTRLQEQKMKKQEEFEESHKLKNLVKGLDDDEADFLEFVDKAKLNLERQKRLEEIKELNEFRNKMAEFREQELNKHIQHELGLLKNTKKVSKPVDVEAPSIGTLKTPQSKLLAGIVKRKAPVPPNNEGDSSKKSRTDDEEQTQGRPPATTVTNSSSSVVTATSTSETAASVDSNYLVQSVPYKGSLVCIGVLPGLASYSDSSNSDDDSSDSEGSSSVPRDLCGRQILHEVDGESDGTKKKK